MNFKKFISGVSALTIAASAFAGMAVTANAAVNTSDAVSKKQDFSAYKATSLTVTNNGNNSGNPNSLSYIDSETSESVAINGLTAFSASGSRATFANFSVADDNGNKYLSGTIGNDDTNIGYGHGGLSFGARNSIGWLDTQNTTWVAEAKVKFYGSTQINATDGSNASIRNTSEVGMNFSYDYANQNVTWQGDATGFTMTNTDWHDIAFVYEVGTGYDETVTAYNTFEGHETEPINKTFTLPYKTYLYIDGELKNSYSNEKTVSAYRSLNSAKTAYNSRWNSGGVGNISFMIFNTLNKHTNVQIDIDDLAIYKAQKDSANAVQVSATEETVDITSAEASTTVSGYVAHNASDKIDVTSLYGTPVYSIANAPEGVSVDSSTGVVTVAQTASAGTFDVTCTIGTLSAEKTITVTKTVGPYKLTAPAFSKVTVAGTVLYSDAKGAVDVSGLNLTGGETITVEKNGYELKNGVVDIGKGNNFELDPTDSSVEYYEDFAYATTEGVGVSTISVTDGKLIPNVANNTNAGGISIPETTITDKLVTVYVAAAGKNASQETSYVQFSLNGDLGNAKYNRNGTKSWSQESSDDHSDEVTPSTYHKVQFSGASNGRVSMYVDGKYVSLVGAHYTRNLTGISFSASAARPANEMSVDYIEIRDMPATYKVSGGGVDGTYLSGTTVTLAGTPTSGSWYDGSDYYKVGDTYTVAGNVEFTDAAPVAPSANLEMANWTSNVEGWTASGNVLTDVKDNSVYGYMATLTANGIIYDSVKVAVKTTEEVPQTDTKIYSEYGQFKMTTGNAVFYIISDVELDTSASRVYCE